MSHLSSVIIDLAGAKLPLRWSFRARYRLEKLSGGSFLRRSFTDAGELEITAELIWAMIASPPHERRDYPHPEDVAEALGALTAEQYAAVVNLVNLAVSEGTPKTNAAAPGSEAGAPAGESIGMTP